MMHVDEIDPTTVPVYPCVRIRLEGRRGEETVTVNGRPVSVGAGVTPHDAAIAAAAAEAGAQHDDLIRAVATTSDGDRWLMVVHADGRVWELPDPAARAARPTWFWPFVAVAVVLMAAVVAVALILPPGAGIPTGPAQPQRISTPRELPVLAPQGWSSHALWASPPLPSGNPAPLYLDGAVVIPTRDALLTVTPDGTLRHQAPMPGSGITAGPAVTNIGGHRVIAAQTGSSLTWWELNSNAQPRSVQLEPADKVSFDGAAPLIIRSDIRAAILDANGTIQNRAVPAGAIPVGANTDGTVTAISDTGLWWHLNNPDVASDGTPLAVPIRGGEATEIRSLQGSRLMVVWSAPNGALHAGIYETTQGMRAITTVPLQNTASVTKWTPAPGGDWGVLDRWLIDLTAGRGHDLGADFRLESVSNLAAFGTRGNQPVAVSRAGQAQPTTGTPPALVLPNGAALIIARAESDERVYLTPRN